MRPLPVHPPARQAAPVRAGRRWAARSLLAVASVALGLALLPGTALAGIARPDHLAPDDSSGALVKDLELSWTAVPGARSYDVQVSDDDDFSGTVLTASTPAAHWTMPVTLPRGESLWRVRARTADGPGTYSEVARFTRGWDRAEKPDTPHLVTSIGTAAPGHAVAVPAAELPAFTWEPVVGASFYEVEVSNRPFTGGSPHYSGTDDEYRFTCYTQHTWFTPYGVVAGASDAPGSEAKCASTTKPEKDRPTDGTIGSAYFGNTTYYWRVRGRDGTLDTRTTPFPDPALSCTGVWNTSGGTPTDDGYELTIPSSPPKYLAEPECSQWADGGSFTVAEPTAQRDLAATPGGLAAYPTTGDATARTVALTGTPLLRWDAVPGAAMYRVMLSRTEDIEDSDIVYETQGTSLSPAHSFADRTSRLHWSVQACGGIGCGPAAPVHSFTKRGTNTVRTLGVTGTTEKTFRWTTQWKPTHPGPSPVPYDDQATGYRLQVDTLTGDFSNPLIDVKVDHLGDDPKETYWRTIASSLPDYYVWRVRPLDETGKAWPDERWSYSAPYGRLVTGSGFGLGSPVTVDFTTAVDGVEKAARIVDSSKAGVPGTWTQQSATRWSFAPKGYWTAGQRYQLVLGTDVVDSSGNSAKAVPGTVRAGTSVDSASGAMRWVRGDSPWTRVTASDAIGGSYAYSSDKAGTSPRSYAQVAVRGTRVHVYGCKSPRSGYADVYVDGKRAARLNLYRSYSGCGRLWTSGALADKVHDVRVRTTGVKTAASRGTNVSVDAIRVA